MTEEIPTGEKTTVPASELEDLVEQWEKNGADDFDNGTNYYRRFTGKQQLKDAVELQALIDKHDPKQ
jgi:hypothetical protein